MPERTPGGDDPNKVSGEAAIPRSWRDPGVVIAILALVVGIIWLLSAAATQLFQGGRWVETVSQAVSELEDLKEGVTEIQGDVTEIKDSLQDLNYRLERPQRIRSGGIPDPQEKPLPDPQEKPMQDGF